MIRKTEETFGIYGREWKAVIPPGSMWLPGVSQLCERYYIIGQAGDGKMVIVGDSIFCWGLLDIRILNYEKIIMLVSNMRMHGCHSKIK